MRIRHIDRTGREQAADLFGTFAALARDEVADFPALRAHQRQPWHAFLVQVAALALLKAEINRPPEDADAWRALLLALTPTIRGGEAWQLVVDDWTKPALLQPPGFTHNGKEARTPDELDMIRVARNHDLKTARVQQAGDDDWLFALVTVQTFDGRKGPDHEGIIRMNGADSSRSCMNIRIPDKDLGGSFLRDLRLLCDLRNDFERESPLSGEITLVWLANWDGNRQIHVQDLDPYCVEISAVIAWSIHRVVAAPCLGVRRSRALRRRR